MKCLAVCQDELIIRTLAQVLTSSFPVEFIVESRPLARRLHEAGLQVTASDPRRIDTYLKADVSPNTSFIIEDNGRRSLRRVVDAIRDAGGTLIYVLVTAPTSKRSDELRMRYPDLTYVSLSELLSPSLNAELSRALTRARVQQYQRYFADADRVLILLHNDPDPDAMASGLALRNLLRRTKTTAIIGALQGMTRPENLRMANLLDIHVEPVTPAMLAEFDRLATVDVQPHYFGGLLDRVDLVIDHHPEQPGYSAVFKDIRADYGSTCTILTEHLRAVDVSISERTATAMLYAIKSDTLFFARQTNKMDLEAFTYLYPLADAALIRKMEGAEITLERLEFIREALAHGKLAGPLFAAHLGPTPREDFITYAADFFLQLEETKWTILSGLVHDNLVISVRNLGYSKNAGEFVKRWFADIGSAGGHRSMAKAVIPLARFREKFGALTGDAINDTILDLAAQFLKESAEKRKEPRDGGKPEPRVEPRALLTAGDARGRAVAGVAAVAATADGPEGVRAPAKPVNGRPEAIVR
jgi:nanoRNase/pAp phosphatase (c-di-AMP/oligoRNAs hydrolase)